LVACVCAQLMLGEIDKHSTSILGAEGASTRAPRALDNFGGRVASASERIETS
jgi:hypothetical protein